MSKKQTGKREIVQLREIAVRTEASGTPASKRSRSVRSNSKGPVPFDVDSLDEMGETREQLMSQITFEGSPQLQAKLKALVREFIDGFA